MHFDYRYITPKETLMLWVMILTKTLFDLHGCTSSATSSATLLHLSCPSPPPPLPLPPITPPPTILRASTQNIRERRGSKIVINIPSKHNHQHSVCVCVCACVLACVRACVCVPCIASNVPIYIVCTTTVYAFNFFCNCYA